ncbi:unnamed protein product, partial [Leptidea sinapis]
MFYAICDMCLPRLRDAQHFRNQVVLCENSFLKYYTDYMKKDIKKEILHNEENTGNDYNDSQHSDICDGDDDDEPLSKLKTEEIKPDYDGAMPTNNIVGTKPDMKKTKQHNCHICHKQFTYFGSLEMHIKTHSNVKTYKCLLCPFTSKKNKDLVRHIESDHKVDGQFSCSVCHSVFDTARLLKNHFSHHLDRFKCEYCGKEFLRKKGLKEHLITHTGERKFSCSICSKSFGQNHTLKSHILTHTG